MRVAHLVLALGASASACAEPVVELSLRAPAADQGGGFDTSCVTAVDVFTVGADYPTSANDFVRGCVPITTSPASFAALRDELAGKIDVRIPASGLARVELFGRRGSCSVDASLPIGDLVFYAGAEYIGQDELALQMDATVSCDEAPAVVRPIDILALTTGPTRGDCAAARAIDGPAAGAGIGSMASTLANGVVFYDGLAGAALTDGVAVVPAAPMTVGPKACLAVASRDATFGSISCVDRTAPKVCASAGELEAPGIPGAVDLGSIDQARKSRLPGIVFGAVVGADRLPIQGATIAVDANHAEVVYVEPGTGRLTPTGGNATGPSGLFMVYTDAILPMTVTAGARSRTTTIGAISNAPAAALVMLP